MFTSLGAQRAFLVQRHSEAVLGIPTLGEAMTVGITGISCVASSSYEGGDGASPTPNTAPTLAISVSSGRRSYGKHCSRAIGQ